MIVTSWRRPGQSLCWIAQSSDEIWQRRPELAPLPPPFRLCIIASNLFTIPRSHPRLFRYLVYEFRIPNNLVPPKARSKPSFSASDSSFGVDMSGVNKNRSQGLERSERFLMIDRLKILDNVNIADMVKLNNLWQIHLHANVVETVSVLDIRALLHC